MIERSIVEKEFQNFVDDHDTSWASLGKVEPLAVMRLCFMLQDVCSMMKLSAAENKPLDVSGDSEFLQAVKGKNAAAVWAILDDLMDTIKVTAPRAYETILRRIREIGT